MKKLKITSPQWANYTGSLGIVHFTNGVSDGLVPENVRRRLSIGMDMVEIDEDGNEENNSATYKLLHVATIRASVTEPLTRQTEAEKTRENLAISLAAGKQPTFYTKEHLEAIADKDGINGLRDIAKIWDVKHRSIPMLISMILDAQQQFLDKRQARLNEVIEKEVTDNKALKQAAMSGDFSAAINVADKNLTDNASISQDAQNNETPNDKSDVITAGQ